MSTRGSNAESVSTHSRVKMPTSTAESNLFIGCYKKTVCMDSFLIQNNCMAWLNFWGPPLNLIKLLICNLIAAHLYAVYPQWSYATRFFAAALPGSWEINAPARSVNIICLIFTVHQMGTQLQLFAERVLIRQTNCMCLCPHLVSLSARQDLQRSYWLC